MLARLILFTLLLFPLSTPLWAEPALDVALSKDRIKADEITELKIQMAWPKTEGTYSFGLPELRLENLTVTNESQSQESYIHNGEEWTRKLFTMELTPQKPGEARVEGFIIAYANSNVANSVGQFPVETLKVTIDKPAFKMPGWLLKVLAGIAGVGALLYIGGHLFRRKTSKQKGSPVITQKIESPMTQALERLEKSGDSISEISKVFREFLAGYYSGLSARASEPEMASELQKLNLPTEDLKTVQRILGEMGEVKFMGRSLSDSEFKQLQKEIAEFIESKRVVGFPA